jgi:hypothetical protein
MAQLISENVSIYFCDLKTIVNQDNYNEFFKPHQKNALLVKILCGDDSDCIKGIKGLKETTLIISPNVTSLSIIIGKLFISVVSFNPFIPLIQSESSPHNILTNKAFFWCGLKNSL